VQNEYDQIPLGLLDRLKRILPFADIVADKLVVDKLVCEEMDLLEDIIPRMYEVIHKVANVSCGYVKSGRWSPDGVAWLVLIIAARTVGGSAYQEPIGEMDRVLTRVVEDFDRAVNVEALRRTKETGKHPFSHSLDRSFSTATCRAANFA